MSRAPALRSFATPFAFALVALQIASAALSSGCGQARTPDARAAAPRISAITPRGQEAERIAEIRQLADEGEVDEALSRVTSELRNAPESIPLLYLRSLLRCRTGANSSALEDLQTALALAPEDAVLLNNRGFLLLEQQSYEAAMADFDAALKYDPNYSQAHNNRGLALLALGRHSEAIDDFNLALKGDPEYVDAYNNRGFAEVELGQVERALSDFNTAIRLQPNYVNAYSNRGILQARAGDLDAALVDFTQAAMLDTANPKYYRHRREVYLRLSQFDKARADEATIEKLEKFGALCVAVRRDPTAENFLARARYHEEAGAVAEAFRDLAHALEIAPDLSDALVLRAKLHLTEKNYRQAIADCTTVLEQGESQLAYSVRGDAHLALHEYDQALADFDKSKRFDASVAEAFFRKSQQLAEQGARDDAETQRQRALALDPEIENRLR